MTFFTILSDLVLNLFQDVTRVYTLNITVVFRNFDRLFIALQYILNKANIIIVIFFNDYQIWKETFRGFEKRVGKILNFVVSQSTRPQGPRMHRDRVQGKGCALPLVKKRFSISMWNRVEKEEWATLASQLHRSYLSY